MNDDDGRVGVSDADADGTEGVRTESHDEPAGDPDPAGGGTGAEPGSADAVRSDGGVATRSESTDYLNAEVNIFKPSTPFMRDHLRVVWTGFAVWALIVFGPVTLTAIAPDLMSTVIPVLGFPLHYFLVAIGAPGGALILAFWYARKRDQLDDQYGIDHGTTAGGPGGGGSEGAAATDGGTAAAGSTDAGDRDADGGASE